MKNYRTKNWTSLSGLINIPQKDGKLSKYWWKIKRVTLSLVIVILIKSWRSLELNLGPCGLKAEIYLPIVPKMSPKHRTGGDSFKKLGYS